MEFTLFRFHPTLSFTEAWCQKVLIKRTHETYGTIEGGRKHCRKCNQRWNIYAKASGADSKEEATKCAIFLHTIGEDALEVYDIFTEDEKDKLDPIISKLETYYTPKKKVTYERYIFNSCAQNSRSIVVFVTDLRSKAKTYEFGALQDSLIKDRIVCGNDGDSIRELTSGKLV